jgi:hypothetical protein
MRFSRCLRNFSGEAARGWNIPRKREKERPPQVDNPESDTAALHYESNWTLRRDEIALATI